MISATTSGRRNTGQAEIKIPPFFRGKNEFQKESPDLSGLLYFYQFLEDFFLAAFFLVAFFFAFLAMVFGFLKFVDTK
jgi:hypothetical protein